MVDSGVALQPSRISQSWAGEDELLSRRASWASSDIDAVHEHMVRAFCPHELAIEGGVPPVAFRHSRAALKSATFNATDYGTPYGRVVVAIPPSEEFFLVQFTLRGRARFIHQGSDFELAPGFVSVLNPSAPIHQVTHAGCRHFTIRIARAQLESIVALDVGLGKGPLNFKPDPVALAGPALSFAKLVRMICEDLEGELSAYTHPHAMSAVEDALGRLLLLSVPHSYSDEYATSGHRSAAPYYVRRVEDYVRAHFSEPVSLTDLILIGGVSGRSLHAGFRRFRNETPMGYLKTYRLERARLLLQQGVDKGLSVTDVALVTGFTNLSKFAQDYRSRFGELPSWTLKRRG